MYDGAEIHESVLTLLALERAGATARCCAPDVVQAHVINHLTGQVVPGETRNVLAEAARIARGAIDDVAAVSAEDLDGLILPGGFGAAKNLSDFAFKGSDCTVHPEVARLIREMRTAGKPIAFLCIAPVIAAKVLGREGVGLTIGSDAATAEAIERCGAAHIITGVREAHTDRDRRVVSSAAYMLGQTIGEVADGIERAVSELLALLEP